jgi:hypothetical protein
VVGNAHSLLIFGIPTNAHLFTSPHPLYPTVPQRSHLYNTILSNRASKEFTPVRPKPSRVLPKSKPPAIRTMLALSYSELINSSVSTGFIRPCFSRVSRLQASNNRSIDPRVPQPRCRATARVHGILPASALQPCTEAV